MARWAVDAKELEAAKVWWLMVALKHAPELADDMAMMVAMGADHDRIIWHAWRRWWANAHERN